MVLISEHRDGEMVARAAESLGYGLIRGSTTRGADRALISLVRELQAGREVAITPDGPKGPAEKFAPGASDSGAEVGFVHSSGRGVREPLLASEELGWVHDSKAVCARDGCLWTADQGTGDEPARCPRGSSAV